MSHSLLVLTVLFPLALAGLGSIRACRGLVTVLVGWAALPALLLAITGGGPAIDLPWLLLGARWGIVDPTGRVFLGVTSALWLAAGHFSHSYLSQDPVRHRFDRFFLLTMAGNLGAIISLDVPSFLFFYTLMSLVAYGLIVHDRTPSSRDAGRIYIVLAIVGEALCLSGSALAAFQTGTTDFEELAERLRLPTGVEGDPLMNLTIGLVLVGFGIKLGVMPLHVWLPLAHPVAPTPASAVLSGAMIKIGLLGMLRFLPLGSVPLRAWGEVCLVAGIVTAFLAALIGTTQRNPKTVLAYSSTSQMGLVAVALGAGLISPAAWETIRAAILLFVAHHSLCKGGLFLGVAVAGAHVGSKWKQWLILLALAVSGLSLAGLPLTSGFAAKTALKYAGETLPGEWAPVNLLLPWTGVTTALLIVRFLWLVRPAGATGHGRVDVRMVLAWGVLTLAAIGGFAAARGLDVPLPFTIAIDEKGLWSATWPLLIAAGVAASVLLLRVLSGTFRRISAYSIPPGDLVVPLVGLVRGVHLLWDRGVVRSLIRSGDAGKRRWERVSDLPFWRFLGRAALRLESDFAAGMLIVLLLTVLFVLLVI